MNFNNILFIAPHSDDAELCCGGSIVKFLNQKKDIQVTNCSLATGSTVDECVESQEFLGIPHINISYTFKIREFHLQRQELLEKFRSFNSVYDFDTIFIPTIHDTHQDHKVVAEEAFRAFKFSNIISWETPWNNLKFSPNFFVPFGEEELKKKIDAVNMYKSQRDRFYFKEDYLRSWARMRGGQINKQYAEAFEIVRIIQ